MDFEEVFQSQNHHALPADWYVIITDIVNSTTAIEQGLYKDVNIAGGLTAMAISNAYDGMDFPFIFGGDGMTCLVPPVEISQIKDILVDTRDRVQQIFELDLRIGVLNIGKLEEMGHSIRLSKLKVSPFYDQAILHGDSMTYIENLIKQPEGEPFLIRKKQDENIRANFEGFTCRWEDIPSTHGEMLSTIIMLRKANSTSANRVLSEILYKRRQIFGDEDQPVTTEKLQLAHSEGYLGKEATVFSGEKSGFKYFVRLLQYKFEAMVTGLAIKFKLPIRVAHYELENLKTYQVASSDYQKYDGSLKIVIDSSPNARIEWITYLEKLYHEKQIYYGVHVSDRALITCLLHEGSAREVHFIDAADGGYAMAAKQLKEQMLIEN